MAAPRIRIDGITLLVVLIAAALLWLYSRRDWFNPFSEQNLVYQGAADLGDAVGIPDADSRGVAVDDYVFAVIDKINPFNDSDIYADYVLSGRDSILQGS